MALTVDPATFRDILADPGGAESLSAAAGTALVVVEVRDAAAGIHLAGLDITSLPAVVIVVAQDPGVLAPAALGSGDVILTQDAAAGAPFAGSGDVASEIRQIASVLESNPVAGAALAMLLRSSAGLSVPAALVAESATYSALQEGEEFRRWRLGRPVRGPDGPAAPGDSGEAAIRSGPGRGPGPDPQPGPGRVPGPDPGPGPGRGLDPGPGPEPERVRVERAGQELRITLARPERRNALDRRMRDALTSALVIAACDPSCQVVLRGLGPDFCAGGDLDEFGSRPDPATAHLIRLTRSPARVLHRVADRTTAYLHGSCLGAGIELPAFAGRVIAAPDARFGLPEVRLGLVPGAGGTASLPRRIGRWRTAYLALSGHVADAEQALRWGLVDAVLPDGG